jgi:hypothetical protein
MRRAQLKDLIDQGLATNAPFRLKRVGDRTRLRASNDRSGLTERAVCPPA